MTEKLTQVQYAKHRGISKQAVNKHVKSGLIELDKNGKIDPKAADKALDENLNPAKQRNEEQSAIRDLTAAEKKLDITKKKMEIEKAAGLLVPVTEVKRAAYEAGNKVKEKMLAIPNAIAGDAASMTNEKDIAALIRTRIKEALSEVEQDVRQGL